MPSTKVSTVRVTSLTHQRLDDLMTRTDRSRSQLVRYALRHFFGSDATPQATTTTLSEHISLRLPTDIADQVAQVALDNDVAPSDVIRCAIDAFLDNEPSSLGMGVSV